MKVKPSWAELSFIIFWHFFISYPSYLPLSLFHIILILSIKKKEIHLPERKKSLKVDFVNIKVLIFLNLQELLVFMFRCKEFLTKTRLNRGPKVELLWLNLIHMDICMILLHWHGPLWPMLTKICSPCPQFLIQAHETSWHSSFWYLPRSSKPIFDFF